MPLSRTEGVLRPALRLQLVTEMLPLLLKPIGAHPARIDRRDQLLKTGLGEDLPTTNPCSPQTSLVHRAFRRANLQRERADLKAEPPRLALTPALVRALRVADALLLSSGRLP